MRTREGARHPSGGDQQPLRRLAADLAPYETFDLVRTLAALQLMPENADRLARLEAGAVVAASIPPADARPRIGARRLRWLLNEGALTGGPASSEDPYNAPFAEGLDFIGGNYLILPGQAPHAAFVLGSLAEALAMDPEFPDRELRDLCLLVIRAALRVSDVMARRAGLGRGTPPRHGGPRDVVLPTQERLSRLKAAVSFTRGELVGLLGEHALDLLAQLISVPDPQLLREDRVFEGRLHLHPLLMSGDDVVVALPTTLAPNVVEAVLRLLLQDGHRNEVVQRYRTVVTRRAIHAIERLDAGTVELPEQLRSADGVAAAAFSIDVDKVMTLILTVDDLSDYDPSEVLGTWGGARAAVTAMERRQSELEEHLIPTRAPNEVVHVHSITGFFRGTGAGLGAPIPPLRAPRAFFHAAELEAVCTLEHGNPLALYKYIHAHARLRERTRVMSYGSLDEFAVWRNAEHSYNLSDERLPDMMSIAPAGSDALRLEVIDKTDLHSVPTVDGTYRLPVMAAEGDRRVPVYGSLDPRHPFGLWVEIDTPCWVTVAFQSDDPGYREAAALLAQALAYWIWRLAPNIGPLFERIRQAPRPMRIEIRPLPGPGWTQGGTPSAGPVARGVAGGVEVDIPAGFVPALGGPDNSGERALMTVILRQLRDAAGIEEDEAQRAAAIEQVLNERMQIGLAKKFILLDPRQHWHLRPDDDLPELRFVQEADSALVLDELGPALARRLGLRQGPVADEDRLDVLRGAVEWTFEKLEGDLLQLDQEGLLERLVLYHERLLREDAIERLQVVTRVACYSDMPELLERIRDRRADFTHAAIAYRTLIELAVARPARGLRPFSLERLDRMLALADEGVRRAMTRDAIQNSLSDVKLSMLESGRLGMSRGTRYETGNKQFRDVYTRADLRRATEGFARNWSVIESASDAEPPAEVTRVAAATQDEFGLPLLGLLHFLRTVLEIGMEQASAAKVMAREDLRSRVRRDLNWDEPSVELALDLFTLGPRDQFLVAPEGHDPSAVWPWRFNRQLSDIRRPLLMRVDSGGAEEIVWGNRHVQEAAKYLIELCLGGRLRAKSPSMTLLVGELRTEAAEAFNERVANVQRAIVGAIVRTNVKKVGRLRITRESGEDLGDIDVLAVIPGLRRVRAIESKDLSIARTPVELGHQAIHTFRGTPGHKSDVSKHVERAQWLLEHMPEVLAWLGVPDTSDRWKVDAFVVIDEELLAPFVLEVPLPVVPYAAYLAHKGSPPMR